MNSLKIREIESKRWYVKNGFSSRNTYVDVFTAKRTTLDELLRNEESNYYIVELSRYMAEIHTCNNADPCLWWKNHKKLISMLAILAEQILCIPTSSASSKRVFSKYIQNELSPKYNRMSFVSHLSSCHLSALIKKKTK